ncbi:MAG: SpoIID/LytB domain-containing protein [Bacillota bacterium]|jgi:stage II sporulation protein D
MIKTFLKRFSVLLVPVLWSLFLSTAFAQNAVDIPGTPSPLLVVGLARVKSIALSCKWSLRVVGAAESSVLPPNTTVVLRGSGGQLSWEVSGAGGIVPVTESGPVQITVADPQSDAFILVAREENASPSLAGTGYTGRLVVMPDKHDLVVANVVDIEDYVKSVVSWEMSDSWPLESLKAQAVAARSYAANKCCFQKTPGFGLRDYGEPGSLTPDSIQLWANDQIYKGVLVQNPNAVRATEATRGEILTYGGTPIAAYFHASAEGMTEDACHVWGGSIPYLRAVEEVAYKSPYSQWGAEFDMETLSARLGDLGVTGPIDSICGTEPGPSGRWYGVSVRTPSGTSWLKGTLTRGALGTQVRSLLFSSFIVGKGQMTTGCLNPSLEVTCLAGRGSVVLTPRETVILGGGNATCVTGNRGLHVVSGLADSGPSRTVLTGKGWGHGVGLSQWGARAMALGGSPFSEILAVYYPDTVLDVWW